MNSGPLGCDLTSIIQTLNVSLHLVLRLADLTLHVNLWTLMKGWG